MVLSLKNAGTDTLGIAEALKAISSEERF